MAGNRFSGRPKRIFQAHKKNSRDYGDPLYLLWRQSVRERDGFVCQMPNCSYKSCFVHVHHIKPWQQFPTLRYVVSNGICLCPTCHKIVTTQEMIYEPIFISIVMKNTTLWEERKKAGTIKKRKSKYGGNNG